MTRGGTTAALALTLTLAGAGMVPASGKSTVNISGNAYAFIFGGNNDRLEGAVIRVEEFPDLQTTAGANGAYSLQVPNNATITPYAEFPGYYPTHLQTFHTDGTDLRHVNFQVPEMSIAKALAGITGAKFDADTGLLDKCAIVSTFFEIEGRTIENFDQFHDFHPHGVEGSTATQTPVSGRKYYFNKDVIPDPDQESSSRDGGVLWADVERGTYAVTGANPDARFASFRATCVPGRLVNANPPWGLYQLAINESTNPAALRERSVAASLKSVKVKRTAQGRRTLNVRVRADQDVAVDVAASQGKRGKDWTRSAAYESAAFALRLPKWVRPGGLRVTVKLRSEAGNVRKVNVVVSVPSAKTTKARG